MGANFGQVPGQPATGQVRRRGNEAATYHGAGSGKAAATAYGKHTRLDREALRDQQLAALAQALGIGANLIGYGMQRPVAQAYPAPFTPASQGPLSTPNISAGMAAGGINGGLQSGAAPNLAPRLIFVNGRLVPDPQAQQQGGAMLPEDSLTRTFGQQVPWGMPPDEGAY